MTGPTPGYPGQNPEHGGAPQYGTPQYGAPQYGAPQYGAPQQGQQPQYGAPQQPQYGAPQQPQYGAPQQPQYGQPQYGDPQNGPGQYNQPQAAQYGQPQQAQYGAPQSGYPQYAAPQQPQAGHYGVPNSAAHPYGAAQPGLAMGASLSPKLVQLLWAGVAAGVLTMVATLLPWVSGGGESSNGLDDELHGVWALVFGLLTALIAAAAIFATTQQPMLPMIAGGGVVLSGFVAVLVGILGISKVGDAKDLVDDAKNAYGDIPGLSASDMDISYGFGLWATILFGLVSVAIGGAIVFFRLQQR